MTCPAPWMLSTCADGELAAAERIAVEAHAHDCARCRAALEALTNEAAAFRAAFAIAAEATPVPRFAPPARMKDWAAPLVLTAALGAFIDVFWSAASTTVPSAVKWLNPFAPGRILDRVFDLLTFIVYEGIAMWTTALNFIGSGLLLALFGTLLYVTLRSRSGAVMLTSLTAAAFALPFSGHAFEVRKGTLVTVAAGETIDDTLFAAGETVAIDGDVNGDLLAFGRSVTVRGNVAGDLITGGETITVEGSVGGNVVGGARALRVLATRVGRNVYGAGNSVELGDAATVGGNAVAAGETVTIGGSVAKDLMGVANTFTISGTVGGDVEAAGSTINVLPSARILGSVTGHVDSTGDLQVSPGATIGGAVNEQLLEREARRNPFRTVGYYARKIVGLGTAFVTGFLLLWAFPALREVTLPNVVAALRAGGIGLAAAVTLPVVAILACVTIIGIPLGILIFVLGAVGLYFAKAVVGGILGRALLQSQPTVPHYAWTLLLGLTIIALVTSLPFIGGIATFLVTVIGFGLIVSTLIDRFSGGAKTV